MGRFIWVYMVLKIIRSQVAYICRTHRNPSETKKMETRMNGGVGQQGESGEVHWMHFHYTSKSVKEMHP